MSKAKLIKNLCRELDELGEKRELSMSDIERAEKMSAAAKNLMKMEMYEDEGYSGDGEWEAKGEYSRRGYSRRSSYDDGGYSGRRHYVTGHYSRDAYPMTGEADPMERREQFQNDMRW